MITVPLELVVLVRPLVRLLVLVAVVACVHPVTSSSRDPSWR